MGYESRIFVVERCERKNPSNGMTWINAHKIAEFDLGKIGMGNYRFYKLFKNKIDYTIFVDGEETSKDKYGEEMKYANIKDVERYVEDQIEKEAAEGDLYMGWKPFLGLLKGFDENEWQNLQVVHYGY